MSKKIEEFVDYKEKYLELEAQTSIMELNMRRINALSDIGVDLIDDLYDEELFKAEALLYSIYAITHLTIQD